jgi:glycerophosphoryl diester phosphodiesterase
MVQRSWFLLALMAPLMSACGATLPSSPAATPAPSSAIRFPNVLVVAHRGGAALAPENTLAAFDDACTIGVDMVECDVHLSRDGEVVVMHDPDVSRTTNGRGQIGTLTLAELKALNAAAKFGDGTWPAQTIPTLGELLDEVKGKAGIQIEIKSTAAGARYPGLELKVIDLLKARAMTQSSLLIAFDFPTLKDIKAADPSIQTGALVTVGWMALRANKTPDQILDEVIQATGADYFMPALAAVSEPLVQAAHARGLKMGVWTVDTPSDMVRLAEYGVDALTCNKPDELKRVLGK